MESLTILMYSQPPHLGGLDCWRGESPRYGHTCHVVGNSQMLTVGGARYENVSEGCDWELKSVAVLKLNDTTWGSVFAADTGQYTVPQTIYRVIGGR